MFPHLTLCPCRDICMRYCATNIPKAERRDKSKNKVFQDLALPRRILYYLNIAKAERRDKSKNKVFQDLALPRRILYYPNIMKAEGRDKYKIFKLIEMTIQRAYSSSATVWPPRIRFNASTSIVLSHTTSKSKPSPTILTYSFIVGSPTRLRRRSKLCGRATGHT